MISALSASSGLALCGLCTKVVVKFAVGRCLLVTSVATRGPPALEMHTRASSLKMSLATGGK